MENQLQKIYLKLIYKNFRRVFKQNILEKLILINWLNSTQVHFNMKK